MRSLLAQIIRDLLAVRPQALQISHFGERFAVLSPLTQTNRNRITTFILLPCLKELNLGRHASNLVA